MKKITYTTPYIRNVQVTSKSALFAGSDKTGTLIVLPDQDGNLTPGGSGDASGGLAKKHVGWSDEEFASWSDEEYAEYKK